MLVIVEKSASAEIANRSLNLSDKDTVVSIFGPNGVVLDMPDPLTPVSMGKLEDLIKNDNLENAISFETMDYFMAKSILGSKGQAFRDLLIELGELHEEIVFMVDPGFMTTVCHKLIETLWTNTTKSISVASTIDCIGKAG